MEELMEHMPCAALEVESEQGGYSKELRRKRKFLPQICALFQS